MECIYKKWRELTVDFFQINYKKIRIKEIINYPPAGNDVVEATTFNGQNVIIKYERSKMADFKSELRNIQILSKHNLYDKIPEIIENGFFEEKNYIVTKKIEGDKLSNIFKSSCDDKYTYLYKYGQELAKIHKINFPSFHIAKQRIINDYPKKTNYKYFSKKILNYILWLKDNKPEIKYDTFIHGDFHYGNILWNNKKIKGVIDFEYSGMGFKEQDIAWALILRPSQEFMNDINDINAFLDGYKSFNNYDDNNLKWCLINGYCHFYLMNKKNKLYCQNILNLLKIIEKM